MSDFKKFLKNKKITVMGLGILGRGLGYTKFLAECGADLIVTDLKTKKQLLTSIKELSKYKNIKYTLGKHDLRDFKDRDMILKSAGVPIDSIYIKEARKNKILKQSEKFLGVKVHIGGNVRGVATLPLLKKVKAGDILVAELDSWQLQGFGDDKISPHISVFTSFMPDHMNYYMNNIKNYFADKANIFKYQKENDVLIVRPDVKKIIPKNIKSKLIVVGARNVTKYKFTVPGKFQKENLACAVEVARQFDISVSRIGKIIKNFKGLEGRLQYIKTVKGIKIYNDNNATIPKATICGIEALSVVPKDKNLKKKIILICGGSNKNLDLGSFVKVVNKFCKAIIFIPGTGTDVLRKNYELKIPYEMTKDLKNAVQKAMKYSQSGDIILFSPAFASFGMFNNEYERNDLFMKIIKRLK